MEVVRTWTGREADALRQALRMTNEAFASHLGVAVRAVADWRKRPDMIRRKAMQEVLDAALERAAERAKAQFALLLENDNRYLLAAGDQNGMTPDDKDRLNGVIRRPSRLDAATVENLSRSLPASGAPKMPYIYSRRRCVVSWMPPPYANVRSMPSNRLRYARPFSCSMALVCVSAKLSI